MRALVVAAAFVLFSPGQSWAEWQLKPFVGFVFGGETTLFDPDPAVARRHGTYGASVVLLGEMFGVEADVGFTPGLFESGRQDSIVVRSGLTTLSGSVVVAVPRRLTQYTLRPYAVAGLGVMWPRMDDRPPVFRIRGHLTALNVGGGVTGFVTDRIGVSWDVRYFRSIAASESGLGLVTGDPMLSVWRASMALTLRY